MGVYYAVIRSNELCHFGIKGMKWGVWNEETRARKMGLNRKRTAAKKRKEVAKKKDKKVREKREEDKRRIRSMSDEELQKKLDRINMEIRYREAVNKDLHPAREAVSSFMAQHGRKALGVAAAAGLTLLVRWSLDDLGSKMEGADKGPLPLNNNIAKRQERTAKFGRRVRKWASEIKVPKPK